MRWLCLMFDTVFLYKKQNNIRLWMLSDYAISQSFFWTTFFTFEHYCIACLAAVLTIWKRDLMWIKISPLLVCFLLNTQVLVLWFVECMTIKCIVSNYILVLYQSRRCLCFFFPPLLPHTGRFTPLERWNCQMWNAHKQQALPDAGVQLCYDWRASGAALLLCCLLMRGRHSHACLCLYAAH